jgi:putative FmdB family regulatory protein
MRSIDYMAIYVYKCKKCGKTFESFQRALEGKSVRCIYCGSEAQRVFSPAGIVLKGSGFYSTDYRSKHKGSAGNDSLYHKKGNSKKPEINSTDKKE